MSQFYVLLMNIVAIAMISVAITSEKVNHGFDQIEKPIMSRISNIASSQNQNVAPFADSSSIFFNLFKCKKPQYQYQYLDIIPTTTTTTEKATTVLVYCICVPFYLCNNGTVITNVTDGKGIIAVSFRRCLGIGQVCCYPPNITTPLTSPFPWQTVTYPPILPTFPILTTPTAPLMFPNCICVQSWLCSPNGIVSVSGEGIIVPRYGLCPGNLVCCRILVNTTQPPTIPSTTMSSGQTQLCFVCGNVTLCLTCNLISTPGGGSAIDPRFSQVLSNGNICSASRIPSCQNMSPIEPIRNLGPKNSGTSQECYCVKTWQCSEGNVISPDGLGVIDSRFTICSSADEVCCRMAGISLRNADTFVSSSGHSATNKLSSSLQSTCGVQDNSYAPPQSFPPNSEKTYFAEFPWMVALFLKSGADGSYVFHCGASVVNNEAVLTAAHCVVNQKPENLVARFGQWNIGGDAIQPLPIKEVKILAIAIHPSYYNDGLYHDVAVLILTEPVTYSANIRPICLPEQGMVFATGTRCYGIGWGRDSFGSEGQHQAELRKVNLPIVDRENCQTRLRSTKLGQYFELHGSFICAGGEANKDTCRGDGGGPLICQILGQFFQAGIVSWGIGCGANVPAVYASVSQHRQWIDQQFATYGI